jgi:hypothetical protein
MARFTISKDVREYGKIRLCEQNPSLHNTDREHVLPAEIFPTVDEAYRAALARGTEADTIFWVHLNAVLPAWITPGRAEDLKQRGILHHVAIKEAA